MSYNSVTKEEHVFLVTTGDGSDGDEWSVLGIFTTEAQANEARTAWELVFLYRHANPVEKWRLNPKTLELEL